MKRTPVYSLALALSLGVSGLAFAATNDAAAGLTTPPAVAKKTRYVPSVPAPGDRLKPAASAPAPAQKYVPSVPAKASAAKPAPVAAPAAAPAPAVTASVAPKAKYVPSVPAASEKTEAVTEAPKKPVIAPAAPVAAPAPKAKYVPSVKAQEQMAAEPQAPSAGALRDRGATVAANGINPLSGALAKAYNFNPELKSFRSRLKAVNEQVPQAYAGWLPTAVANYSYGWEEQKSSGVQLDSTHPEAKSVTVTQPIFNGGETIARTDRAFNAVEVGRAQLTDSEQQVLADAVKAYMDVVRTEEILKLSTNNEQVLREQLQATRDRFKLGETTRTDVAQSEARLARATSDKVRAAGDFDVSKANYQRVIGEPAKNTFMPEKLPTLPKTLEEALQIGLKKNPNMIAAEYNREIADNDISINQAALLPDVSLRASKSDQEGLSTRSGRSLEEEAITLNASIPIFQSGAEYSRVRQSKRQRQQRVEEFEATHNQTVEQITSRWRDVETARASIVSSRANVESAKVALAGVRQEQDVGTRTTLDVLDAEQELFVARVNLVTALAREVIAAHALLAAMGNLTAQDLALNVEVYDPKEHLDRVKYRVIGF